MKPKSILRRLQKRARNRLLTRDAGVCVVCGSRERVEAAHMVTPPTNYFLSHTYETDEQNEKDATLYYQDKNMLLLCRKCHMLYDYPYLLQEFAADVGREKATGLVMRVLIDAGVTLEDLKGGGRERVRDRVMDHMFVLYGSDYGKFLEELRNAERKRKKEVRKRERGEEQN
jgi:hypothetical protein